MPDAYKYLNEYNTGNSGKESYSRHSNHLAFMQGNSKDSVKACYNCGNQGYTVRTCPVCNSKKESKPAQGVLKKKEYSPKPQKFKKVSFATTVKKKGRREGEKKRALGFAQLGNMGSCQPSNDVEMPDYNLSILGKEDIHQNPKVEERLQAHE